MFDNIEVEEIAFVATDGRWDNVSWVNEPAEISAMEDLIESGRGIA